MKVYHVTLTKTKNLNDIHNPFGFKTGQGIEGIMAERSFPQVGDPVIVLRAVNVDGNVLLAPVNTSTVKEIIQKTDKSITFHTQNSEYVLLLNESVDVEMPEAERLAPELLN